MYTLGKDTVTALNTPSESYLCRWLVQLLSNLQQYWFLQDFPFYPRPWGSKRRVRLQRECSSICFIQVSFDTTNYANHQTGRLYSEYREVNTGWFAQVVKCSLLPNRVAFHLNDSRWDFWIYEQVLQLLSWEVAYPNCTCLTWCIQALHCSPCFWEA